MKNIVIVIAIALTCVSCVKNANKCMQKTPESQAPNSEIANVKAYLTANSLVATEHPTGLFYNITNGGTGNAVKDQCSQVAVNYRGKLTNGTQFDASTATVTFNLFQLINGWRIGIPYLKAGGSIKLYVPPSLGYGANATPTIPANSILIFDIDLVGTN